MQVKLTILGILYVLCFTPSNLMAQAAETSNTKNNLIIEGTVYDQSTRKPLEYASVALANNQIGTITNAQGKFRLVVPMKHKDRFIKISYIGYKTMNYKVSKIITQKKFWLPEDPRVLAEVTIQGLRTATILKKALQNIPKNYYQKPYTSTGFYRAVDMKDNQEYIAIGEGAFEVYQMRPARKNQVLLGKMRSIRHQLFSEWFLPGLGTTSLLEFDIVNRSKKLKFLDKKGAKNHTFEVKAIKPYEGSKVYIITFDQKDSFAGVGYTGELWIDTKTFAFVYLDIALSPKGIKYHKVKIEKVFRLHFRSLGIGYKLLSKRLQYRYKKIKGAYYLHRVHLHRTQQHEQLGVYDFEKTSKIDYVVTAYHPERTESFSRKEVKKSKNWIQNQPSFFNDIKPGYWDAYNILLPEVAYATIAKQIKTANEALKKTSEAQKE
ncbi:MAG TPA: hypothetical protein DCS93_27405 [Microscillaceae bacterium]|nr:hypothetical protein [Microscillaceae bacterium]